MQTLRNVQAATDAAVDQVIAALYDGVMCPGDWYDALDASRLALGADSFFLFTVRRDDATVFGRVVGNAIEASGVDGEPLDALAAMTCGAAVGVPMSLRGPAAVLAMVLRSDEKTREVIVFIHARAGTPWADASRAVLDRLAPHLVRASVLRAHIRHLAAPAAIGLSTLDGLSQGIAVVDEECRVQYLNRAAQACCAADAAMGRVEHGCLLPAQLAQRPAFRRLVRLACVPSASAAGGASNAWAGAGVPTGLSVWPLKADLRHLALVAFAAQPGAPGALNRMLGLTPTEAGLALWLAEGKTLRDYAGVRQCSGHTARSHLKNLLQKTGCHRQMELVQLVQAMRPVWSAGP